MRNELLDLYNLACANPKDKDIVQAYQKARDRIGPQIAIHEVIDNDLLRARVARLEEALREIRDYNAYKHPDVQVLNHRNRIIVEINECSACQHAKQAKWPPSGLCSEHYGKYQTAQRRVEEMHDYKQAWEPREIARRALEEK